MDKIQSPLILVIIPTYNDEPYIKKTLASVHHFFDNLDHEIIVVDDGSSDDTIKQVKSLSNHYGIRLYQRHHQGVSSTRNWGILHSRGRYLMFCDGDDRLVGHLPEFNDADIISFSKNCRRRRTIISKNDKLSSIASMFGFDQTRSDFPAVYGGSVSKLFNRQMIVAHQIHFDVKLANSEDILFNAQAIIAARKINIYGKGIYLYCHHGNSVTHKYDKNLLDNHLVFLKEMRRVMAVLPDYSEVYERIKSLYLYQLVFRQFVFNKNYHCSYRKWVNSLDQKHWSTELNRPIERWTVQLVNSVGIQAAVIMARFYLHLKKVVKHGAESKELL